VTRVSASALAEHFSVFLCLYKTDQPEDLARHAYKQPGKRCFLEGKSPESQCARNLEASAIGRRSPCQRNGDSTASQLVKSAPVVSCGEKACRELLFKTLWSGGGCVLSGPAPTPRGQSTSSLIPAIVRLERAWTLVTPAQTLASTTMLSACISVPEICRACILSARS
jgi:hypothetical protein